MVTFLEEEDEAIVVLRVLGVLEVDGDEQVGNSKQSLKPPESTCFLSKSDYRNNGDERNYRTITITGMDLEKTQEK
jgi:hypothetical protein